VLYQGITWTGDGTTTGLETTQLVALCREPETKSLPIPEKEELKKKRRPESAPICFRFR
jgi:hypothetical protein